MPVVLHIITGPARDLFTLNDPETEVPLAPALTFELFNEIQPVLAGDFVFGGVFDRFPELIVALGEYEVSWLPYYTWRMSQLETDFLPLIGYEMPKLSAIDYLLGRVYYGLVDDPLVELVTSQFGSRAKLMWGSDFPHVRSTFPRTHEILEDTLGGLPNELQQEIAGRTAAELFHIALPTTPHVV